MYLFRCDFSSCLESTQIWHAYSFCVKTFPCVFSFKKAEKYGPHYMKIDPPPPPTPPPPPVSVSKHCRIPIVWELKHCPCVCFTPLDRAEGGGGGGLSRACLKPRFPACEKKHGDIFWHKKSQHAKFQLEKSNRKRYIHLCLTEPFNHRYCTHTL